MYWMGLIFTLSGKDEEMIDKGPDYSHLNITNNKAGLPWREIDEPSSLEDYHDRLCKKTSRQAGCGGFDV